MSSATRRYLPALLIILAGVLVYWNSFDGVFVYDDIRSIRDNPYIRTLWPLSRAMSVPLWSSATTVDGRPLLSLTFALNQVLLGPDPWGYHLVNLLIHIAAGLLLFGVVRRTLGLPALCARHEMSGQWLALAMALIWLVHPLQTESVTYIVQRAESLMGMLYLLTIYCAIRGFTSDKGRRWHIAAVLACACGMGVKQTMFSAPLLVLLYDWLFVTGSLRASLKRRRPFYVALFSAWLIVFGIIVATWKESTIDFVNISPVRYLLTQPLILLYYMRLAIWPSPLALEYGWPLEEYWPRIVFPALAILAMLAVMFRGIGQRKWYGFVLAWFFLILAPTSSIAPTRQVIFEHRMYLSLAAVIVLIVLGVEHVVGRLFAAKTQRAMLGGCLLVVATGACGYLTHDRNKDYHSAVAIWEDNVGHRPGNKVVRSNLGDSLNDAGRHQEAEVHLREALRLDPTYAEAHNNLGNALLALGRPVGALKSYGRALQLSPGDAEIHSNLGSALLMLGRTQEAILHFQESLILRPGIAEVHYNTGLALESEKQPRAAMEHYQQALRIHPDLAQAHYKLGIMYRQDGRLSLAIQHLEQALRLRPDSIDVRDGLRETRTMLRSSGGPE